MNLKILRTNVTLSCKEHLNILARGIENGGQICWRHLDRVISSLEESGDLSKIWRCENEPSEKIGDIVVDGWLKLARAGEIYCGLSPTRAFFRWWCKMGCASTLHVHPKSDPTSAAVNRSSAIQF